MTSEKRSGSEEVVDMEMQCVRCKARLYVPISQAGPVIASLQRTGAAILICVCGQAQLIQSSSQKRHGEGERSLVEECTLHPARPGPCFMEKKESMRTTRNGNRTGKCTTLPGADAVQIEPLIVIAEEQPAIRDLLRWILHLAGYRATVCVDRQAALTWGEQAMTPGNVSVVLLLDLSSLCTTEAVDFLRRVRTQWQAFFTVPPQIIARAL